MKKHGIRKMASGERNPENKTLFTFAFLLCTFTLSLAAKNLIYDQIDDWIREN
jgi:hypothetical protein